MQLHAASIGSTVPRDNFNATIQSVFDSSLNLRLAHEGRLVTILISDHYDLPQGIRLDKKIPLPYLTPSTSLMANVGSHAACRGGILRFDSSPLTIDLRGAPVWKCRVPELNIDMRSSSAKKAWSTAWGLLNKGQKLKNTDIIADDLFQSNADSQLSQRISRPVMQLVTSTEKFDPEGSIHAAEKMIGLGPGVTPSGDDILIGFLAGLWSTKGENQGQLSFIHSFGNALMQIATQTNEISRTYLHHATQGQFSSSLSKLAEALATGSNVEQAIHEAMRVGHSSGMDSVTGLLIGLCVWNMEHSFAQKALSSANR